MIDLTPEHTKRSTGDDQPLHKEIIAAHDYVDSVIHTCDYKHNITWHGWALREAFLAGISYAQKQIESSNFLDK